MCPPGALHQFWNLGISGCCHTLFYSALIFTWHLLLTKVTAENSALQIYDTTKRNAIQSNVKLWTSSLLVSNRLTVLLVSLKSKISHDSPVICREILFWCISLGNMNPLRSIESLNAKIQGSTAFIHVCLFF